MVAGLCGSDRGFEGSDADAIYVFARDGGSAEIVVPRQRQVANLSAMLRVRPYYFAGGKHPTGFELA
jgi:hypothetical protein